MLKTWIKIGYLIGGLLIAVTWLLPLLDSLGKSAPNNSLNIRGWLQMVAGPVWALFGVALSGRDGKTTLVVLGALLALVPWIWLMGTIVVMLIRSVLS